LRKSAAVLPARYGVGSGTLSFSTIYVIRKTKSQRATHDT
jgi:hypothetical protein